MLYLKKSQISYVFYKYINTTHSSRFQHKQTFLCSSAPKPTVESLKLSGVQCGDRIRHARRFADSVGVNSSDSEVVRVAFKQPRHWIFTDLYGVIVTLAPVVSSNLTSKKGKAESVEQSL